MIIVEQINVIINTLTLLHDVSCSIPVGRCTSFIGMSGAGKTTLLKTVAGLVPITAGHIRIDGQEIGNLSPQERSKAIGYVFQDFNLFPHYTAIQNCIDPLLVCGISHAQAQERALQVLKDLGMDAYVDTYPCDLSGGQQQRIAIARALCLQPSALLLDEPTASLDPFNTDILVSILQSLTRSGLTIALSSQDTRFINRMFDRVYYLKQGTVAEFCDGIEMIEQNSAIARFLSTES